MKTPKVCLLVDNSNTRTKFALGSINGVGMPRMLPTKNLSENLITELVRDWRFDCVCLCSVVPEAGEVISKALGAYPLLVVNPDMAAGMLDFSCYPGVATLGADRIANSIAAQRYTPYPLVAVDMGTATTFDVVLNGDKQARFAGGVIAPGFKAFAECLPRATAQLPQPDLLPHAPIIGRNTQEALSAGVCRGYAGLVDSLLDNIEQELGEPVHVILTGGDAEIIAPLLKRRCCIVPALTLHGIAMVAGVLS